MRCSRTLAALTLTLALSSLAGCGGDADDPVAGGSPGGVAGAEPASEEGSEGSEGEVVDICTLVTAEEVGAVLDGAVTGEEVPGGGCNFDQEDPRAPSLSLSSTPYDEGNGGFDAAKVGVTSIIDGDGEDLDLGDEAFVVIGPALGGSSDQGGGLIRIGATIVQVTLLQGVDLSAEEVRGLTSGMLELVASKA